MGGGEMMNIKSKLIVLFFVSQLVYPAIGLTSSKGVAVCVDSGCNPAILVYSNDRLDVYTDNQTINEGMPGKGFYGHLYIAFKNENVRKKFSTAIREHALNDRMAFFEYQEKSIEEYTTGKKEALERLERDKHTFLNDLDKKEPTFNELKYVSIEIQYFTNVSSWAKGSQPPGQSDLPVLHIGRTLYLAQAPPLNKAFLKASKVEEYNIILLLGGTKNPVLIASESPNWSILASDIDPQTSSTRIDKNKDAFLYQIMQNILSKIDYKSDK